MTPSRRTRLAAPSPLGYSSSQMKNSKRWGPARAAWADAWTQGYRVVVSLGNLRVPPEEQARVACLVEQRLRGQTHPPGLSDPASVLSLADGIAKRVDRQGRRRSAPQPPGPGPKPAAGWVLDGVLVRIVPFAPA